MGIDCLGPRILKECAHILFQPLHYLFCLSLSSHSIPEEWRIHRITPIHKSSDRSLVSNYQPISLLCSISKVLERIIYNHVLGFISCSISPSQFGFLRNRSTAQQLLTFLNCVHESLQAKTQSDVIYLDFRKAFDSVSHNELLFKLWCLGIRGNLWCWSRRIYSTECNVFLLTAIPLVCYLFYLVFPKGAFLVHLYSFSLLMTSLSLSARPPCSSLLTMPNVSVPLLTRLTALFYKMTSSGFWIGVTNGNFISTFPSVLLFVFPMEPQFPLPLPIAWVIKIYLLWTALETSVFSFLMTFLGLPTMTYSAREPVKFWVYSGESSTMYLPLLPKKNLYISFVRSQLTYCSVVWRPHLIKDITTLEKIQRRASKYILSDVSSDYKSRLSSLNMLPLMMQLELYDILLFIKSLKYPSESFNILVFASFCSGSSRSATHLKLQLSPANRSTNRIRHFYFSRLPRLWNYLPTINLEKSVMSIKSDITAFFWSRFQQTFDPSRPCTYHAVCPCARCSLYLYLTTLIWLLAPTSGPSVQNSFVLLCYFVIIITPIPVL